MPLPALPSLQRRWPRSSALARALWLQLRLPLGVAGGVWLTHFFSAMTAVGSLPWPSILAMSIGMLVQWLACAAVQQWVMQALRHSGPRGVALRGLQFISMWALGTAAEQWSVRSDFAERLGLQSSPLSMAMFKAWTAALVALVLLALDVGEQRRAAAGRRLLQLQREQHAARRRLVEAELQALQARIDPRLFFETLDSVQALHASGEAARAEALMEELIVFLRAALPRLRGTASTLAQELEVLTSYLRLGQLAGRDAATLTVESEAEIVAHEFPAGVLLPLLSALMDDAGPGARFHLRARSDAAAQALVVTLRSDVAAPPGPLRRIEETLVALHGPQARPHVAVDACGVHETRMTIPDEPGAIPLGADGDRL